MTDADPFELTADELAEAQELAEVAGIPIEDAREIIYTGKVQAAKDAGRTINFKV